MSRARVEERTAADSGNLEIDLPELLLAIGQAAKAADSGVALLVDEVQYLDAEDLRALIVALHRIAQRGLPLVLFGAGLPQAAALAGEAKSYAERLFDYPAIGALADDAARRAVREPIRDEGAGIEAEALDRIVAVTHGCPYFANRITRERWPNSGPVPTGRAQRPRRLEAQSKESGLFEAA